MTDRDAFLRAIAASPDDDTPRLVFADYLDENGDPALAGFIRDQITLETMDEADAAYPETLARMRRRGVFTRKDRTPWLDAVPEGRVSFRRGLIDGVRIDPTVHLGQSAEEWERVPLSQLSWEEKSYHFGDRVQHALMRPELSRIYTLCTAGWSADCNSPLLKAAEPLANLRSLRVDLSGPSVGNASDPPASLARLSSHAG